VDNLPAAVRDRLLRKSVSMSILSNNYGLTEPTIDKTLSPVQQSPTTSAPQSESKRPSRIPTPVYSSGSLARPRRERDDSASSLLTAIKHSEDEAFPRNGSMSSPAYSSPSASRNDLTQAEGGSDVTQTNGSTSNRLLSHTNTLRGPRPVGTATQANADQDTPANRDKRPGAPSPPSTQSRCSDMSELRKENLRRMRRPAKVDDGESNAIP
jgi:hypothetical protein